MSLRPAIIRHSDMEREMKARRICAGLLLVYGLLMVYLLFLQRTPQLVPLELYIEFSTHKVADAIADSAKVGIELLHSCHNVADEEVKNGVDYLSLMQQNIETLAKVLN